MWTALYWRGFALTHYRMIVRRKSGQMSERVFTGSEFMVTQSSLPNRHSRPDFQSLRG